MSSRHHLAAVLVILMAVVVLDVTDAAAQLTASWIDNSNGAAAFSIERRLSTDTAYASLASVPTGITTYLDASAAQGVSYCYRVLAYDAYGTSAYSNEACGAAALTSTTTTTTTSPTTTTTSTSTTTTTTTSSDYTIAITKSGNGDGTVTSSPTGISCGTSCAVSYPAGTLVTVTAAAASGSRFVGWSGGCSGTGSCTVVGNSAVTVSATFNVLSRGQLKRAGN
jgi:List-Bact-rpt repeat protein